MATNAGSERNSSDGEDSEGNSPPNEAPEDAGSQDENAEGIYSEAAFDQGQLDGDQGKKVMLVPKMAVPAESEVTPESEVMVTPQSEAAVTPEGEVVAKPDRHYPMPQCDLLPVEQIQCFKAQCKYYCECVKKQDKEIENYINTIEQLEKKIEDKDEEIKEQKEKITEITERVKQGEADHEQEVQELHLELKRMERDRREIDAELKLKKKVAENMVREIDTLRDQLKKTEESRAEDKQIAEMRQQKIQKLSDELKCRDQLLMVCTVISALHEALYQGLLFYEQQVNPGTWKMIFVIIRNNPFHHECALRQHGDPDITLRFNIAKSEVQLSLGRSKFFPNWEILPRPLPQLKKDAIDAYNGEDAPLPSIRFSVQCTSQTYTPKFQCRFNLEGILLGVQQPCKFFTVCLPHKF